LPIALLYHDVVSPGRDDESGFPGTGAARYKLPTSEFKQHLQRLSQVMVRSPLASQVNMTAGHADWLITFDDGGKSFLHPIADLLEDQGWRGWFFITTGRINTPGFMTTSELKSLAARGHVIGSHSVTHPARFSALTPDQLLAEWQDSRKRLQDWLGLPIETASVPGGFYSPAVATSASAAGVQVLFNSEPVSGISKVAGCQIVGRYTLYRGMTAQAAVGLLTSPVARWRQMATWNAKKLLKKVAAKPYRFVRERILQASYRKQS
jgi:peptidoglycan/xylan/chitin deacetylase (PgdA/CDA1 family)